MVHQHNSSFSARDKPHWMEESHVQKDPKVMKLESGAESMEQMY